jgi:hypothetical protein
VCDGEDPALSRCFTVDLELSLSSLSKVDDDLIHTGCTFAGLSPVPDSMSEPDMLESREVTPLGGEALPSEENKPMMLNLWVPPVCVLLRLEPRRDMADCSRGVGEAVNARFSVMLLDRSRSSGPDEREGRGKSPPVGVVRRPPCSIASDTLGRWLCRPLGDGDGLLARPDTSSDCLRLVPDGLVEG